MLLEVNDDSEISSLLDMLVDCGGWCRMSSLRDE